MNNDNDNNNDDISNAKIVKIVVKNDCEQCRKLHGTAQRCGTKERSAIRVRA